MLDLAADITPLDFENVDDVSVRNLAADPLESLPAGVFVIADAEGHFHLTAVLFPPTLAFSRLIERLDRQGTLALLLLRLVRQNVVRDVAAVRLKEPKPERVCGRDSVSRDDAVESKSRPNPIALVLVVRVAASRDHAHFLNASLLGLVDAPHDP